MPTSILVADIKEKVSESESSKFIVGNLFDLVQLFFDCWHVGQGGIYSRKDYALL